MALSCHHCLLRMPWWVRMSALSKANPKVYSVDTYYFTVHCFQLVKHLRDPEEVRELRRMRCVGFFGRGFSALDGDSAVVLHSWTLWSRKRNGERKSRAGGTSAQPEKLLRPFYVFTRVQRDDAIRDKALEDEQNARTLGKSNRTIVLSPSICSTFEIFTFQSRLGPLWLVRRFEFVPKPPIYINVLVPIRYRFHSNTACARMLDAPRNSF